MPFLNFLNTLNPVMFLMFPPERVPKFQKNEKTSPCLRMTSKHDILTADNVL